LSDIIAFDAPGMKDAAVLVTNVQVTNKSFERTKKVVPPENQCAVNTILLQEDPNCVSLDQK
jgi:hypothetical protein